MLEKLKEELVQLHLELPKNHLVTWTGGNVSARDPQTGLVVIKASGIRYEEMRPRHMVVVNAEGQVVEGDYKTSSDVYSHVYIYRHRPEVEVWCIPTRAMPPPSRPSAARFLAC